MGSSTEKLAAIKAAKSMGVPLSQFFADMQDDEAKSDIGTFKHSVKTKVVRMLEDTLDNKPHATAWDMADEAMNIIFDAYMVDMMTEHLHETVELLADYVDADHDGTGFVPNGPMTLSITAETILRRIECPLQLAADKLRSSQ